MKRKAFLVLGVLLVFCFVSPLCFAQTTNDLQQFVGTWKDIGGSQWVFRADGTGSRANYNMGYAIPVSGKIVIHYTDGTSSSFEYYFADGGRTLIFYASGNGRILKKSS